MTQTSGKGAELGGRPLLCLPDSSSPGEAAGSFVAYPTVQVDLALVGEKGLEESGELRCPFLSRLHLGWFY